MSLPSDLVFALVCLPAFAVVFIFFASVYIHAHSFRSHGRIVYRKVRKYD